MIFLNKGYLRKTIFKVIAKFAMRVLQWDPNTPPFRAIFAIQGKPKVFLNRKMFHFPCSENLGSRIVSEPDKTPSLQGGVVLADR